MATIKRIPVDPVPPPPDVYQLTLSKDEAQALTHVLGRIGGSPLSSPRGLINSILDALTDEGFKTSYVNPPFAKDSTGLIPTLYFKDNN